MVKAEGHSGYAASGSDIVCAAVSAVVQTAVLGVERVAGCEAESRKGGALLEARFARPVDDAGRWAKAQAILETTLLGLREIEEGRESYVRVIETRVGGGATT